VGRRGPPRKPTILKRNEGTYRKDLALPNECKPEPAMPAVPSGLSRRANAEWRRVSKELFKLGLLSRIDRAALAAYCESWADWLDATEKVNELGKVIKTQNGNVIENPYYSIKKRASEIMHRYLTEFGMTPASRTGINAEQPEATDDGLGTLLSGPRGTHSESELVQ
jgi:P27 family predicted phage terminase small subunit